MYVVFVESDRSWLYVCNLPVHMNDTSEQNRQHYFEKVNSLLKNTCHTDKMRGRLKCIEGHIVFFHILFFCKNTASYLREYLVFKAIILNKLNLSKKNVIQET